MSATFSYLLAIFPQNLPKDIGEITLIQASSMMYFYLYVKGLVPQAGIQNSNGGK
ncbi:MAG: hypothetical protein V7K61_02270 [Nostoc sp.]